VPIHLPLTVTLQAFRHAELAIIIGTILWRMPQMKMLIRRALKTFKAEGKAQKTVG